MARFIVSVTCLLIVAFSSLVSVRAQPVPTHDHNNNTPPYGQVAIVSPSHFVVEDPPGKMWEPVDVLIVDPSPLVDKEPEWVDPAITEGEPPWELHNLSLLYLVHKISSVEYAYAVAKILDVKPGSVVTVGGQ